MTQSRQQLTHTPYYEAWRERLRATTTPRGAKTDLARFLSLKYDTTVHRWQVELGRIQRGEQTLSGEYVLAITHWMDGRTPSKPRPAPRTDATPPPTLSYT